MEKNIVIAPSALAAARYMKETYGISYQADYPLETLPAWPQIENMVRAGTCQRILILHQQVLAHALREYIFSRLKAEVMVASWFDLDEELRREGDRQLHKEKDWIRLVEEGDYDLIIGDSSFEDLVPDYKGAWIDLEHFAVSGRIQPDEYNRGNYE